MLPNEPKCLAEPPGKPPVEPLQPPAVPPRQGSVEPSKNPVGWLVVAGLAIAVLAWFAYGWIEQQREAERMRRFAEIKRQEAERKPRDIFGSDLFDSGIFDSPWEKPDEVQVSPYRRDDGTFVRGHYRTEADDTTRNNWTTKPNVNPYTGERGYRSP